MVHDSIYSASSLWRDAANVPQEATGPEDQTIEEWPTIKTSLKANSEDNLT